MRTDFLQFAVEPKTLRLSGTIVDMAEHQPTYKNIRLEIIPFEGYEDRWQYGAFSVKVTDAKIDIQDHSEKYFLTDAEEEIRRAGYDYADGCDHCCDDDSSPSDVLTTWIEELTAECLTEGEPDLCEKYWSSIDFDRIVNLFREGLEKYFAHRFSKKEEDAK